MFFRRNISLSPPEVPNSGQRELRLKKRAGEYFDKGITETSGTKLQARSSLNLHRPIRDAAK